MIVYRSAKIGILEQLCRDLGYSTEILPETTNFRKVVADMPTTHDEMVQNLALANSVPAEATEKLWNYIQNGTLSGRLARWAEVLHWQELIGQQHKETKMVYTCVYPVYFPNPRMRAWASFPEDPDNHFPVIVPEDVLQFHPQSQARVVTSQEVQAPVEKREVKPVVRYWTEADEARLPYPKD